MHRSKTSSHGTGQGTNGDWAAQKGSDKPRLILVSQDAADNPVLPLLTAVEHSHTVAHHDVHQLPPGSSTRALAILGAPRPLVHFCDLES